MSSEAHKVQHPTEHTHPGPAQYVRIAVILAVVTAIEVAIYYFNLSHALLITLLLTFSLIKFVLVAMFFMHLKFDSPMFRRLFITGVSLAILVYTVVLATFLLR
ncbi:MAG: cytochrome C oxidase subunit IV family protein [Actinomycetota bacterium]|nr:cytochrome C oxidase subunit IV family protein [Actinomycetota bacterium]